MTFNAYALQFARRRLCCRLHLFLFAIQAFDFPHSLARLGFSIFILCVSFCFTHLVQLIDHRFMLSKKNNRPFLQWRPNDTSKRDFMWRAMKIINKNSRATAVDLENIKLDNMSSSVFVYSMNVYCFTLCFQLARNSFIQLFVRSFIHSHQCLQSFTIHNTRTHIRTNRIWRRIRT